MDRDFRGGGRPDTASRDTHIAPPVPISWAPRDINPESIYLILSRLFLLNQKATGPGGGSPPRHHLVGDFIGGNFTGSVLLRAPPPRGGPLGDSNFHPDLKS